MGSLRAVAPRFGATMTRRDDEPWGSVPQRPRELVNGGRVPSEELRTSHHVFVQQKLLMESLRDLAAHQMRNVSFVVIGGPDQGRIRACCRLTAELVD